MSWLQPTPFEQDLVSDVRRRWPEIVPLARLLSLATRIEPLLLRNARLQFIPGSATEIESQLWFSPLIGARSSGEVILHAGVARLLADELRAADQPPFDQVSDFTRRHSRHWSPEDRLEQDLRLAALLDDQPAIEQGLQDMLKRIHDETDEEQRIRLARWSRRSLASVAGAGAGSSLAEASLLTQYASCSLGASSSLAAGNTAAPATLPGWLNGKLPEPFRPARLAVSLHWDADSRRLVLHCRAASAGEPAIELPTPLPVNLHVQCEGAPSGTWHVVGADTRVALPLIAERVLLTTSDGRRYELRAELPTEVVPGAPPSTTTPLYLSHLAADREQASRIADWLARQGIRLQLIEEESLSTAAAAEGDQGEPIRLLRLWTRAAQAYWAETTGSDALPGPRAALLRTEALAAPPPGQGAERLLDLLDWQQPEKSEEARNFLGQLRAWLADEQPPPEPDADKLGEGSEGGGEAEALLAELADPKTPPPRRLAIGDRLAEIGDPRRGVGVREFVLADAAPRPAEPAAETRPPEVHQLLDELERIETLPPRRLAIGDRLAEIGDPRAGVGLDVRGLPALDWVEIPGGEFIYQNGEKRRLPTFRMARYPITNAQYQAFIDAGGYTDKGASTWWRDLKRSEPAQSSWPQANRPRTDVDWYEAVAFSRWLSAQLGYEVRLPSEEEWERAVRGRDGREYPWGKDYRTGYANIDEKGTQAGEWDLEQTTAVGVYPQGASSEGVLDLAGNVWEWCLDKYDRPGEVKADTSDDRRVARGGAWYYNPGYARGSRRFRYLPDVRNLDRGFRLVSSAPIA
ncbi:MAG: SUMF1/EgtB/PvdO family nonheme iron enzyme [Candidatus Accumulibacter meliphilus]|jgi:hypothetical protein|uniref:formylglycine-generating enzyme family protein n=1 Tax=Candidatus Accumulibacter meliphilus TaxID=2211374 RepID=UPI002FC2C822